MAADAERVAEQQVGVEAGAARVDPPAAVDRDRAGLDARPFGARLVAVGEGGVAAAEIGVALPRRGVRETLGDGDRVRHLQRLPQRIGLAQHRHRLAVAQMGVDIHEADLAPEERREFGAAEDPLRAAAIRHGPVHQPDAVGEQQMLADQAEVMLRLLRR